MYVLAAVVADRDDERCRQALRDLRLRREPRLHFTKESPKRRRMLAEAVGRLALSPVVVVRASADQAERARSKFLVRLAWALADGVEGIVFESRETRRNRHDEAVVASLVKYGACLTCAFVPAADDLVLWRPISWPALSSTTSRVENLPTERL